MCEITYKDVDRNGEKVRLDARETKRVQNRRDKLKSLRQTTVEIENGGKRTRLKA